VARALVFLLSAVLIWGVQPLVIRAVLGFFSVEFAAFARSVVAAAFFGVVAGLSGSGPPFPSSRSRLNTNRVVLWLLVGGAGLGFGNVLWNASLTRTTVGASSVLQMGGNVVIALYGILILRERCNTLRAAAGL